jgi:hypothetical protein
MDSLQANPGSLSPENPHKTCRSLTSGSPATANLTIHLCGQAPTTRGILVFKKWIDKHFKLFGVLLLVLAAVNTWVASEIFLDYPITALANGAMAIVIVVGVLSLWSAGEPK